MDKKRPALVLTPLFGIPDINKGDDLVRVILDSLKVERIELKNNDVIVIAQKIVSKSEGRLRNLKDVSPSREAKRLGEITGKDPRLIELILQESNEVLRIRKGLIIVEHKLGFVCANAGIDHSNVKGTYGDDEDWVLLLPQNPDQSASAIRSGITRLLGIEIGVLIIDSHGRAWRLGTVGVAIGVSGLPALVDLRGVKDLYGFRLRATDVGVADELAAAASLMMGQAAEGTPVIHVRGFPYNLRKSQLNELIRPKELDLFR
ncbi:MAG TPA: coenzyme F420-0:L-glutamate ligase [Anaerolineae bacterium]|nr:coenzyme F420-0:L-glutamate ligase [Anaerolineae bacterium]